MKKADISFFALVFFITRAIFNLVKIPNLTWMVALFLLIIILLILISKINIKMPTILSILYIILGINIIDNMASFIELNYFSNISYFIIKIPLLIVLYIVVSHGFDSIKSTSEILFFIFIIVFFIVMINSCFYINPYNIVNYVSDFKVNISYSSFLPLFIILVFYSLKDNYIDTRSIIGYFVLSFLTIIIEVIIVNGVIGHKMIDFYFYPTTRLLNHLPFFSFSNRLDYLLSIVFLFESTITLAYILEKIKKENKLFLFFGLIILLLF